MTLLQNWEHGTDAFDQDDDEDNCFVAPASFMVMADHNPRRDDRGPLGQRFCQLGLEVVGNYPKPTSCTPMCHDTNNVGGGTSDVVQLAGQTSNSARCAISSTGMLWWHGAQPQ